MATPKRSTRSVPIRFKSYVVLNQWSFKVLSARISIVSSKGTLGNSEETSYDTKISPVLIFKSRISFLNLKVSVTVYRSRDKGFSFLPCHLARAKLMCALLHGAGKKMVKTLGYILRDQLNNFRFIFARHKFMEQIL